MEVWRISGRTPYTFRNLYCTNTNMKIHENTIVNNRWTVHSACMRLMFLVQVIELLFQKRIIRWTRPYKNESKTMIVSDTTMEVPWRRGLLLVASADVLNLTFCWRWTGFMQHLHVDFWICIVLLMQYQMYQFLTQSYDFPCFSLKGCISSKHFSMHQPCAFGQVCCVHVKRHFKRLRQLRCAGGRGWTSWTVIETCRGYGARILLLFSEDRKKQGEKKVQCHKFWWIQSWTYWFAKCTILIRGHFIWHQAVSGSQWSVRM